MKRSLVTRIALFVLVVHAVLLPAVFVGVWVVVRESHANLFVQNVRTYSRNLVALLEFGEEIESRRVAALLDLAITNGGAVYAELMENGVSIRSELGSSGVRWPGRQDLDFADSPDRIYFLELPVHRANRSGLLRIGFGERSTDAKIRQAMRHVLWVLAAYLVTVFALAIAFGIQLSRPILDLARAARRIASGSDVQSLKLVTKVRELHELGTDLENMREALVGVNARLQSEIVEREAAQTRRRELERQLRHRQRLETVGTLAGGIAHEINNALLPIMLLAEAAQADVPETSAVHRDLQQILQSARHAKEIVAKVLAFGRDTGVAELRLIDPEAAVREAMRLFGLLVPATVEVRLELNGPYPPILGDSGLLIQLVMNLCTNAYQALDDRPGTLTVVLAVQDVPAEAGDDAAVRRQVMLSVADTGHGMNEDVIERIFDPFFTTRVAGGRSGLGLAVVDGIAGSFGATIVVQSRVGIGSTFKVFFPAGGTAPATGDEAEGIAEHRHAQTSVDHR